MRADLFLHACNHQNHQKDIKMPYCTPKDILPPLPQNFYNDLLHRNLWAEYSQSLSQRRDKLFAQYSNSQESRNFQIPLDLLINLNNSMPLPFVTLSEYLSENETLNPNHYVVRSLRAVLVAMNCFQSFILTNTAKEFLHFMHAVVPPLSYAFYLKRQELLGKSATGQYGAERLAIFNCFDFKLDIFSSMIDNLATEHREKLIDEFLTHLHKHFVFNDLTGELIVILNQPFPEILNDYFTVYNKPNHIFVRQSVRKAKDYLPRPKGTANNHDAIRWTVACLCENSELNTALVQSLFYHNAFYAKQINNQNNLMRKLLNRTGDDRLKTLNERMEKLTPSQIRLLNTSYDWQNILVDEMELFLIEQGYLEPSLMGTPTGQFDDMRTTIKRLYVGELLNNLPEQDRPVLNP